MKRFIVLLLSFLFFTSLNALSNPLFAYVSVIRASSSTEYYYDSNRNLVTTEDVGSGGYVYNNSGTPIGYFTSEDTRTGNVCYYYNMNGYYVGKLILSISEDMWGLRGERTYFDSQNRPVAQFYTYYDTSIIGDLMGETWTRKR